MCDSDEAWVASGFTVLMANQPTQVTVLFFAIHVGPWIGTVWGLGQLKLTIIFLYLLPVVNWCAHHL